MLQREVFGDTFDLATADAADLPLDALIPGRLSSLQLNLAPHQVHACWHTASKFDLRQKSTCLLAHWMKVNSFQKRTPIFPM